ncbi:unnamed protein product, partial [Adineta steineri]
AVVENRTIAALDNNGVFNNTYQNLTLTVNVDVTNFGSLCGENGYYCSSCVNVTLNLSAPANYNQTDYDYARDLYYNTTITSLGGVAGLNSTVGVVGTPYYHVFACYSRNCDSKA